MNDQYNNNCLYNIITDLSESVIESDISVCEAMISVNNKQSSIHNKTHESTDGRSGKAIASIKKAFGLSLHMIHRLQKSSGKTIMNADDLYDMCKNTIQESVTEKPKAFIINLKGDVIEAKSDINITIERVKDIVNSDNPERNETVDAIYKGYALVFIKHTDIAEKIYNIFNSIIVVNGSCEINTSLLNKNDIVYNDLFNKLTDYFANEILHNKTIKCSVDEISKTNEIFRKTYSIIDQLFRNNMEYTIKDKLLRDTINKLVLFMNLFTMGLNLLNVDIKNMYVISKDKYNTISDISTLSIFVENMIKHSYPSKFVLFNTDKVITDAMRGTDKPKNGQTRVVFFSSNDTVTKVALNSTGINSNSTEGRIFLKYKDNNQEMLLAKTIKISKNYCVIVQERCDMVKLSNHEVDQFIKDISVIVHKYNLPDITPDIHIKNIGKHRNSNKLCVIDYGFPVFR